MINNKAPYLIHCLGGIDRTGYAIMVIQALMRASIREIVKTYLSAYSFDNSDTSYVQALYKSHHFLEQIKTMLNGKSLFYTNLQTAIEHYLINNVGLSYEEIAQLKTILKGKC